jgi:RNA polymerase sigma factor (sigma-70 family)
MEKEDIIVDYYRKNLKQIRAFVFSRVNNEFDAEDIVQDVFFRLLNNYTIILRVNIASLVYTIACNIICDYMRHRGIKHTYETFACHNNTPDFNDVSSLYDVEQINEWLEHGITCLSEDKQMVYKLNIYDGMKTAEISKLLNLNYKITDNRLTLARKFVRGYIKKYIEAY